MGSRSVVAASAADGYSYTRCPVLLSDGDGFLLFAEGRQEPRDGGSIDIVVRRLLADGSPATPWVVVAHSQGNACMSPLVARVGGRLVCVYTTSLSCADEFVAIKNGYARWRTLCVRTAGAWDLWSGEEHQLTPDYVYIGVAPGRGAVVDGDLWVPAAVVSESMPDLDMALGIPRKIRTVGELYRLQVFRFRHDGAWLMGPTGPSGTNETTLVADARGGAWASVRTTVGRRMFGRVNASGTDLGMSSLPCPNNHAGFDWDGSAFWFANTPSRKGRKGMLLRKSRDMATWSDVAEIEPKSAHCGYASVLARPDGTAVAYERNAYTELAVWVE